MSAVAVLVAAVVLVALPWTPHRARAHVPRGRGRRRRGPPGTGSDAAALLDLLDVALAAGASVPGALVALGDAIAPDPAGRHLRAAGVSLRLGGSWQEAWQAVPAGLRPLADALEPGWTDGVDPGPLVRRAAATIRTRRRREAQEAAARLGARLVLPLGLCFLPAFVLLAMVPVLLSGAGALLGG